MPIGAWLAGDRTNPFASELRRMPISSCDQCDKAEEVEVEQARKKQKGEGEQLQHTPVLIIGARVGT